VTTHASDPKGTGEGPVPLATAPAVVDVAAIGRREKQRARAAAFLEGRTPMQVLGRVMLYVLLIWLTLVFIIPFLWLVSNSLKDAAHAFDENWIPQPSIQWENYLRIWDEVPFLLMFRNSLIVAILGVVGVALSSAAIAFALARLRFPGRNLVFTVVLATMLLPAAVTMVPVYLIWNNVRMFTSDLTNGAFVVGTGTLFPLFVGNFFGSSFYIFMFRQFFLGIPAEIIEAARVDGAGYFRIWWQLMLPLVRPAIFAVAILEFQAKWNDFLGPLIYIGSKQDLQTLAIGLANLAQHQGFGQFRWELVFAATVLFALPMILLFFFAQKQFIQGIATTGLKG
jgi:multiple sugar transport system permease protein